MMLTDLGFGMNRGADVHRYFYSSSIKRIPETKELG